MIIPKSGTISITAIAMMTVAAVVSLRGLPMMGKEGTQMFFFLGFAMVFFLLPASLVAAELGGAFGDKEGGVYEWIKAAFGPRLGFAAIWLQWIQNVVWYPIVLGFGASSLAYLIGRPELALSGLYTGPVCIAGYWLATFVALSGTGRAAKVTSYAMLFGTALPGIIIVGLAVAWLWAGNPLYFLEPAAKTIAAEIAAGERPHARLFPALTGLGTFAFLGGTILLFAGVEVQAVHARQMANPQMDYPRAVLLAMGIIVVLFSLGSLAVSAIVPAGQIDLNAGLMQAFAEGFDAFGLGWLVPFMGLLLAFGALGGTLAWITGPSRGLLATAKDGVLPPFMAKTNANGIQVAILMIQGAIVTALSSLYLLIPNVSVAFFLLSAMTITLYLVMYMLMYAAAIRLRVTRPDMKRAYRIPGGMTGMWLVAGTGFLGVLFAFVTSFVPPAQLPVGNPTLYVALVLGGFVVFTAAPFVIGAFKDPSWRRAG